MKLEQVARNTKEGIEIIESLFQKCVTVHVLNIGLLEDATMKRFFLRTLLAVTEMERNLIVERHRKVRDLQSNVRILERKESVLNIV